MHSLMSSFASISSHCPSPARQRLTSPAIRLAVLCLIASNSAYSSDAAPELAPILVTGQHAAQNANDKLVKANRIAVEQAMSLQDIFKQTPEVSIGGGALHSLQKFYVRGINERMLRITIDGAAQPEAAYHHSSQVMIEPELMKRVEVHAGTGSATSGPGALAGALQFTTMSASDLLKPGEKLGGMLKLNYFGNQPGHKVSATAYGKLGDGLGILLHSSRMKTQNYRDGHGNKVDNTAADSRNRFVKFDFKTSGGDNWMWSYEDQQNQGMRNKRSNLLAAKFNPSEQQRTERESSSLQYRTNFGVHSLALSGFVNQNLIYLAQNTPRVERDGSRGKGVDANLVTRLGAHKLSYGANWRMDTGFANVAGKALPQETAQQGGIYLEDDWALADEWALSLGARYDSYRYTDGKQQDFSSNGFSPSASLSFAPTQALTLRLAYAQVQRGVGLMEPFLLAYQGNDRALKAEKARKWEISAEWQQDNWQASANVYRQNIANYIGYDAARQNLGEVMVNGYAMRLAYHPKAAKWTASLSVAHARPRLNGVPLGNSDVMLLGTSSGRTWVAQWDYAMPEHKLNFGSSWRAQERLSHVPSGSPEKAGNGVIDAYLQWQAMPQLSVNVSVKNLLNKYYHDQSSFGYHPRWGSVAALPEAGRDLRISANWRF